MAQIPFDHGFRTLGQMRLGDVGHGVVARLCLYASALCTKQSAANASNNVFFS